MPQGWKGKDPEFPLGPWGLPRKHYPLTLSPSPHLWSLEIFGIPGLTWGPPFQLLFFFFFLKTNPNRLHHSDVCFSTVKVLKASGPHKWKEPLTSCSSWRSLKFWPGRRVEGVESRFWGILRSNCLGAHRTSLWER